MNNQDQKRNVVSTLNREKVATDFSNKSASRYLSIHTIVQSLSLFLSRLTKQPYLSWPANHVIIVASSAHWDPSLC